MVSMGPGRDLSRAELAETARQLRSVLAAVEAGELAVEGPKDRGIADRLRGALDVLDLLSGKSPPAAPPQSPPTSNGSR